MALPPLLTFLETALPCRFSLSLEGTWTAWLPGSETVVTWKQTGDEVSIATPIAGAHDGLPQPLLRELLKFNFPNDEIGSSWIRLRVAGHYELADCFSVTSVTPEDAANRILEQIKASVDLSQLISEHLQVHLKASQQLQP